MENVKSKWLGIAREYKDYCIKIDLKNRFKTSLSLVEKKELTRLQNLAYKLQNQYLESINNPLQK